MRVLIAGCGYVGLALGARLVAEGHEVAGVRRPGSDAGPLSRVGVRPLAADLARAETLEALPAAWDWVVHCAAPSSADEGAYRSVYLAGARNLVRWLRGGVVRAFVFTSSTSVYGQSDGAEVDEAAPAEPASATGRVLRETETFLLGAAAAGFPATILRAAGIYGPGRNRLEGVSRGEVRAVGDGRRWVNLIHRDDLAGAIIAALERGRPGAIYNVADGSPVAAGDYYGWLAGELGVALPPAVDRGERLPRTRAETHKRVVANRLRDETGWRPVFGDFRAGYAEPLRAWRAAGEGEGRRVAPSGAGKGGGERS